MFLSVLTALFGSPFMLAGILFVVALGLVPAIEPLWPRRLRLYDVLVSFAVMALGSVTAAVRRINWSKVGRVLMAMLPLLLVGGSAAFASGTGPVQYGAPSPSFTDKVIPALESIAATIRYILGATALVALVIAAFMNHVPNQKSKEQAKEIAMAAVVGLLLAAFAPAIVTFFGSL